MEIDMAVTLYCYVCNIMNKLTTLNYTIKNSYDGKICAYKQPKIGENGL